MPTPQIAKQADAVRASLTRLEANLKALLTTVGGAIGSTVNDRVTVPLELLAAHLEPLLNLLGGGGTPMPAPAKRGPGRPRKDAAEAPPRSRRGGARKKANLTAEKIAAALKETGGNKSAAARWLKVSQPTFYKYLEASKASTAVEAPARTSRGRKRSKKSR